MSNKEKLDFGNKFNFKESYYLISQEWIRKWKHYIGFEEINNIMKKDGKEILELQDYNWVQPLINKNTANNNLEPLINKEIYYKTY